jgi:hypothetical protein
MNENVGPEQLVAMGGSIRAICAILSNSGPNGEPLACGYAPGHDGPHSWSTLPTFPSGSLGAVIDAIQRERAYQDAKWGTIDEHPHTVGEWLLVLEGEIEEAKQAWRKGDGDSAALEEILQVASVAFACMQQHGVIERPARLMAAVISKRQ